MNIEGTPEEIIREMAGQRLPLTNGWGLGVVVGAWKLKGEVRLLLA